MVASVAFQALFAAPARNGIYKSKEFQGHGVRLVKMNQLFSERRLRSATDGYDRIELTEKERQKLLLSKNDLLFSRTSVVADGVGKCSLILEADNELTWDSNIIRVRLDPDIACPEFYFHFFNSPEGRNIVRKLSSGAAVTTITGSGLAATSVPFPPLPVQRRTSSILRAYDDLIEVNLRRITLLEQMARRLFDEWFVRFRFPAYESQAIVETPDGPLPKRWKRGVLGDLISLVYGRALKADARIPGEVAVIGSSGIIGWHNERLVEGPGIVVGRKGNVGAIVWSPRDFYPIDTVFYVETSRPLLFILHLLQGLVFLNSDAAVPGLNRSAALNIPLTIPPEEMMAEYHARVAPMIALAEQLHRSNTALTASRDLLLPGLVSGELSISFPEIELEAVA